MSRNLASVDVKPMLDALKRQREALLPVVVAAADVAVEMILGDAQQLAPVDTGALQGSGTTTPATVKGGKVEKLFGFNTGYAAAVHENLTARHDVGEAKYLEKPMIAKADKVLQFIADRVKAAGEKRG